MPDKDLSIPQDKIEQFNNDTKIIGERTEMLFRELAPYLFAHNKDGEINNINIEKESTLTMERINFYKIASCTIEESDSFFDYLNDRIKKILSVAYSMNVPVCFGIIGQENKTSLVLSVDPTADNPDNAESAKNILLGLLPDISIYKYGYKETKKNNFGVIGGVPPYIIDEKRQNIDYSGLMRALNGKDYTFLIMASPLKPIEIQKKVACITKLRDDCLMISKRNISLQESDAHSKGKTEGESGTHSVNVSAYFGYSSPGGGPMGGGSVGYGYSCSKFVSESITDTSTKGKSLGLEIQNSFAVDIAKRAENAITRLHRGMNNGFWQTAVCLATNDEISMKILRGSLYSEIAKPDPFSLPPLIIDCNDLVKDTKKNQSLVIPQNLLNTNNEDGITNSLCSFMNTDELSLLFTFPDKNVPGYELKTGVRYPVSTKINTRNGSNGIELGIVCDGSNKLDNIPFSLSYEDLNKHTFICGLTGSGKSNTVKHILEKANKPFLVIECAKKEYRKIDFEDKTKIPVVFTLGRPEINCISFNPFYIMRGISPQLHIDFLKDLFNAAFPFYGPMPYILEKCLHNIYLKKGWNLSMGYHPFLSNTKSRVHLFDNKYMETQYSMDVHKYVFPTMNDLLNEIEKYVKEMGYEGEIASNIKTAILARVESLCVGTKGFMFNTCEAPDFDKMLKENTIFELEGLADDSDKAFAVGILIIYITEYRMSEKEISQDSKTDLKHLLVIEEAHRLLKNISTEKVNEDVGNPKGKAVEHFTNMIAEMRSYGQGVIIAEQIPTKIAPDVIKNSSNKIIHRIVSKDDQEIIANMIGMDYRNAIYLGDQLTGMALCHCEGMRLPISVAFPEVNEIDRKDGDFRSKARNNDEDPDFYILKTLLFPYYIKEETEFCRFLHTILTFNAINIIESIGILKEYMKSSIKASKKPRLLNEKDYDIAESVIISEIIIKLLFFYTEKITDKLKQGVENSFLHPFDEPVKKLIKEFNKTNKTKDMVIQIISELAIKYEYTHREQKMDTDKLIRSYFIKVDEEIVSKIAQKIKTR